MAPVPGQQGAGCDQDADLFQGGMSPVTGLLLATTRFPAENVIYSAPGFER